MTELKLTDEQGGLFVAKLERASRELHAAAKHYRKGMRPAGQPSFAAMLASGAVLAEVAAETQSRPLGQHAEQVLTDALNALAEDCTATLADECDGAPRPGEEH